jgi:two-component system, response regulator
MNDKYIFLAEDNANDVALTIRALNKCQIQNRLVVVSDGPEALDYLMAPDLQPLPAVVILDLKLPFVDGFEVLRQIRANPHTQQLPVFILSSSIDDNDRKKSMQLGANGFECKPISFNEFVTLLQRICGAWVL